MIYKISGIFRNTEDAQSAARRINLIAEDIYEIRMNYLTREDDIGLLNNIVYSPPSMSVIPNITSFYPSHNITTEYRTDNTRTSPLDFGESCRLTVLTSQFNTEKIQNIMHNESGYDVRITEYE